jgi:hypothetical protein
MRWLFRLMTRSGLGGAILFSLASLGAACSSGGNPVAPSATATSGSMQGGSGTMAAPTPPAPRTARFRFTFESFWSTATHPQDFPSDPHFSPLVGGTHSSAVRLWQEAAPATEGIRDMAERGLTSRLEEEVRAAIAAGTAEHVLRGGGIPLSPGAVSLEFEISQDHPLVTLVSMVAPSPDWFTGVSGLPLFEGGQWVERRSLDLGPWDAGTDSGTTFTSPDRPTEPRQGISRITGFPFVLNGQVAPIARFTFERIP